MLFKLSRQGCSFNIQLFTGVSLALPLPVGGVYVFPRLLHVDTVAVPADVPTWPCVQEKGDDKTPTVRLLCALV